MFSFDTLHISFRRIIPTLVITAGLLLALEVVFRAGNWFYTYEGWESPGLMKKMEQAEKLFQAEGRIDLVTMSTSVGRSWDVRQWEEATGGGIVAYNFGFPDQRPERQYFLFKNHIFPKYHPTHIIYGIGAGDVNSNIHGMKPDRPRQGPFWRNGRIRALAAKTLLEKATVKLEDWSVMFRSRQRARFTLQHGPMWMLEEDPTIGRGVLAPTVRRQAFGPMESSWGLLPEGLPNNNYHDYWVPDDGEIGELLKLSEFCEKHGIKLAIVEIPASPYAHTNFDDPEKDYWRFTNALDHLAANGAWVLPMAWDLKLDNTYFEDQAHLNRWGGQMVTDYVYRKVIRKWYPEQAATTAAALPEPAEVWFEDLVTTGGEGVAVERRYVVSADAQYAAARQVVVTAAVDITLSASVSQGSYAVEIYGGDGSTTEPLRSGDAKVELAAVGPDGEVSARLPLDKWILSRIGVTYTQAYFTVPTTGALVLRVLDAGKRPLVLDSAFVRRRLTSSSDAIIVE